jgi:phosphohistidine phosphatase SixA
MAGGVEAAPQGRPEAGALTRSYLVRHAEAGDRHAWTQPDELRPLTEEGRRQARGLVKLFRALSERSERSPEGLAGAAGATFDRMLSSPAVRCVQTLEPLAAARGLTVETTPLLAEGAGPAGALGFLRDGAVVVCTHGDVVEETLDALEAAGVALEGRPAGEGAETPKGATWVFEVDGGRMVSGRLLPPP